MQIINEILKRDYVGHAFIASAVLLALTIITRNDVAAVVFATVAFTAFDVAGYKYTLLEGADEHGRPYYRIMQTSFQIVLYAALYSMSGWHASVAAALVWWTGGCDLLYYFIGRYELEKGVWSWLWWTPVGIAGYLPYTKGVVLQASIGVVAAGVLLWLR